MSDNKTCESCRHMKTDPIVPDSLYGVCQWFPICYMGNTLVLKEANECPQHAPKEDDK